MKVLNGFNKLGKQKSDVIRNCSKQTDKGQAMNKQHKLEQARSKTRMAEAGQSQNITVYKMVWYRHIQRDIECILRTK